MDLEQNIIVEKNGTDTPLKKTKRKIFTIIFVIIGITVAIPISIRLVITILNHTTSDISPIDDKDLLIDTVSMPDHENAYFDLIQIQNVYEPSQTDSAAYWEMLAGNNWDKKIAEEVATRNKIQLEHFARAAQKPRFQDPAFASPNNITPDVVLPSTNKWRQIARINNIYAKYLAREGTVQEAFKAAESSISVGYKIQNSHASIIEYLVGSAITMSGLESMRNIITVTRPNTSYLTHYARELEKYSETGEGLKNVWKLEYMMQKWAVDHINEFEGLDETYKAKAKNFYYFRPNKTKLLFAERARWYIDNTGHYCKDIKKIETQELSLEARGNRFRAFFTENIIGKILADIFTINMTTLFEKDCLQDTAVAATQTIAATKAFYNATGHYPTNLGELVPTYLSKIPIDAFDGKPLRYSQEKKIIYSVGKNFIDEGGSSGSDINNMPDPTFLMVF